MKKEFTDEIFVTMQAVLQMLNHQVFVFDYSDIQACSPKALKNLKEGTFLRWFNNPLWSIRNKTVWFDWGPKRVVMSTHSNFGLEKFLVRMGIDWMVAYHRIHCMGYKNNEAVEGVRRHMKRTFLSNSLATGNTLYRENIDADKEAITNEFFRALLVHILQDECTFRGYPDYPQKPVTCGQKYIVHVPRQVVIKRSGNLDPFPFPETGMEVQDEN